MIFYIDASVLVATIVDDEARSSTARDWIKRALENCIVSAFVAADVAAALSRGMRTRRFSADQACAALDDLDRLRGACDLFTPDGATFERMGALARDFTTKLAAPDALHLASAMQAGASLVTFDERLAAVARGADVVVPG